MNIYEIIENLCKSMNKTTFEQRFLFGAAGCPLGWSQVLQLYDTRSTNKYQNLYKSMDSLKIYKNL